MDIDSPETNDDAMCISSIIYRIWYHSRNREKMRLDGMLDGVVCKGQSLEEERGFSSEPDQISPK
jgi:hypothetical protein